MDLCPSAKFFNGQSRKGEGLERKYPSLNDIRTTQTGSVIGTSRNYVMNHEEIN